MRDPLCRVLLVLVALAAPALAFASGGRTLPARGSIEVVFSPEDGGEEALLRVIGAARETLHMQAYVFTSRPIADALVKAHRRGVHVQVLADAQMNRRGKGNALPSLLEAGVPVALETRYAAAHNKVLIADGGGPSCVVATGSYNFTWSANKRNAENLLVLRDNCPLAAAYLDNWRRHREDATPVTRLPWKP
ncbi:phospholipase D family protein [Aromatoleum buckelii]|uniref:phospholipase D n=1 Tax=Aromatoleum buckelii TaxID=200254 RepID=A0ABX1N1F1_9RHOO|nr:phospholipase D family protein [Aromatoleum buckelii]MCK0512336.1 phospholipase D family protein [Aromatoleum buckelii]